MADRYRSKDGVKETEKFTDDVDQPGQQGRAGGDLERKVGTRDEEKQLIHKPGAKTRVRKSDEIATATDKKGKS